MFAQKTLDAVFPVEHGASELRVWTFADNEEGSNAATHQLVELGSFPADLLIVRQRDPTAFAYHPEPLLIGNIVEGEVLVVRLDPEPAAS